MSDVGGLSLLWDHVLEFWRAHGLGEFSKTQNKHQEACHKEAGAPTTPRHTSEPEFASNADRRTPCTKNTNSQGALSPPFFHR